MLTMVAAALYYSWYKIAQLERDFVDEFPGLKANRTCFNESSVVPYVKCTLNHFAMLGQQLSQLWEK